MEDNFDYIRINLASPERVKYWAQNPNDIYVNRDNSEVISPETINYRTLKPEIGGLFCERIFGPVKNWECSCGKYNKLRQQEVLKCEVCGVDVTESRVRRYRMGYIELTYPVAHIWYVRGFPSYMAIILGMKKSDLIEIVYFNHIEVTESSLKNFAEGAYGDINTPAGTELLFHLLQSVDLQKTADDCRDEYIQMLTEAGEITENSEKTEMIKRRLLKRIRILENFIATNTDPTWMLLPLIPVLPPALRPMVPLESGRLATSDLNELYQRVIHRNIRLTRFCDTYAPEIIIRNEKRMLQEAVDALIDNARREKKAVNLNNRPLRSLSDILSGKQGRFRQNLLGKRVDYSGRSVIVVGPELRLNQCGLPYEMACELFQPFIIRELFKKGHTRNLKMAQKWIKEKDIKIWGIMKKIMKGFPIFLNRAPTLHRLGIQAFEPIIVSGRAIKLHPLVCPAFNADFDGDQMAVHIPLSIMAKTEAYLLMLSTNNFLSPATGEPIILPSQDMVLGMHYLTSQKQTQLLGNHNYFSNKEDVILAYNCGKLKLHSSIWLRDMVNFENSKQSILLNTIILPDFSVLYRYNDYQIRRSYSGEILVKYILTTPGRVLFNNLIYSILT